MQLEALATGIVAGQKHLAGVPVDTWAPAVQAVLERPVPEPGLASCGQAAEEEDESRERVSHAGIRYGSVLWFHCLTQRH